MKIFCIGRNYIDHAKELNNPVPDQPMIFMKPPTAMLRDGKPFYIPDFSNNIHYEAELVVKMSKNGKNIDPKFVESYYNELTLGIDFTARDIQKRLKEKGHPWEIAKAFDFSAVVGKWIDFTEKKKSQNIIFSLQKSGEIVQEGNSRDMLFSINTIIVYLSKYFKLQIGDLIYTGTPAGVGKVESGDILDGFIENEHLLHCEIR